MVDNTVTLGDGKKKKKKKGENEGSAGWRYE